MSDFVIDKQGCLVRYEGSGGDVVIPDGVTSIGEKAFAGCGRLTSITIPDSVTSIGVWAFSHCNIFEVRCASLASWLSMKKENWCDNPFREYTDLVLDDVSVHEIVIPEGTREIPCGAFWGCGRITSVSIPSSVTSIGDRAFEGCSSLTSITIPDSVTSIGDRAFFGCSSLTSITIPDSVTRIGNWAFDGCSIHEIRCASLTSWFSMKKQYWKDNPFSGSTELVLDDVITHEIVIPEGTREIPYGAFWGCSKITSVSIPNSVTSIGKHAFSGCSIHEIRCTSLTSWLSMKKQYWEDNPFSGSTELVLDDVITHEIVIPEGTREIPYRAFGGCGKITSVSIPPSVTSIGDRAFYQCSSLTSITIPDSVTSIGEWAFSGCSSLESITIPDSVTSISESAFRECESLREVISNGYFATKEKLYAEFAKIPIRFSDREIAFVMLYQKGVAWAKRVNEQISGREKAVFDHMLAQFAQDNKAPAKVVGAYILAYLQKLLPEQLVSAMKLLEQRKYSDLTILQTNPEITMILAGGKVIENPIEAHVREWMKNSPLLPEALSVVKKGLPYAGSTTLSSREAVAFILSEYAREWNRCATSSAEPVLMRGIKIKRHPQADAVAQALDQASLSLFCESLVSGYSFRPWLIAWASFADEESIERMTATYKTMIRKRDADEDHKKARCIRDALMINDTPAAMQFYERIGELDRYAEMRGMTAMEMRDSVMLPAFDFDADGIKRYDTGDTVIEVSITPELGFRLFDTAKQKEIRSFPKKGSDPAKAEACAEAYAAFKKEVLTFAKERTALLHKLHMSGEWLNPELWRRVYVGHPVIRHLTNLLVWEDEGKTTFVIEGDRFVDCKGQPCNPKGKIRVAHVIEMDPAQTVAWQRYFARTGKKQLFEQVWEPLYARRISEIRETRYAGAVLSKEERSAVKKALALRGIDVHSGEMRRYYDDSTGKFAFSNENDMYFGRSLCLHYTVDEKTGAVTFGKSVIHDGSPREMNAILLVLDKATMAHQVSCDNDPALTEESLSGFTAAQISGLLELAVSHSAIRCTALLLEYKKKHFPEFADIDEFTLDW